MAHRSQENALLMFAYALLMFTVKDTEGQPDGEAHITRSGTSVPVQLGCPPSQHMEMSTNPEAL